MKWMTKLYRYFPKQKKIKILYRVHGKDTEQYVYVHKNVQNLCVCTVLYEIIKKIEVHLNNSAFLFSSTLQRFHFMDI